MALLESTHTIPGDEMLFPEIVELNVGGQVYITRHSTLISYPDSLLGKMFTSKSYKELLHDTEGRFFLDRDGFLFRYILDYMRDHQLLLPEHFPERARLEKEAEYYCLPELAKMLAPSHTKQARVNNSCTSYTKNFTLKNDAGHDLNTSSEVAAPNTSLFMEGGGGHTCSGFITIGHQGSDTVGQGIQASAKFHIVERIMACGKTSLVKEIFGDSHNESRDSEYLSESYTSRTYLKYTCLEQVFDQLAEADFNMVASNSPGNCSISHCHTDDNIWTSHTEYVFYRDRPSSSLTTNYPQSALGKSPLTDSRLTTAISHGDREKELDKINVSSVSLNSISLPSQQTPRSKQVQAPPQSPPSLQSPPPPPTSPPVQFPSPPRTPPPFQTPPLPQTPPSLKTPPLQTLPMPPSPPPPQIPYPPTDCPELPPPPSFTFSDPLPSPPMPLIPPAQPAVSPRRAGPKTLPRVATSDDGGPSSSPDLDEDEKRRMKEEMKKCIEDFKSIRIPQLFPDRKRHWQNDLLKKYNA